MKTSELIEELKKCPQDLDVHIYAWGEEKEADGVAVVSAYGFLSEKVVEIS